MLLLLCLIAPDVFAQEHIDAMLANISRHRDSTIAAAVLEVEAREKALNAQATEVRVTAGRRSVSRFT